MMDVITPPTGTQAIDRAATRGDHAALATARVALAREGRRALRSGVSQFQMGTDSEGRNGWFDGD